jgi:hypothetical protein
LASTETAPIDVAQLGSGSSLRLRPVTLAPEAPDASTRPVMSSLIANSPASQPPLARLVSPPPQVAPSPPPRPINLVSPANSPDSLRRLAQETAKPDALSASFRSGQTAVYDLSSHTVYLPNGATLEAHSGLGDRLDDPNHVDERNRGATPPLYNLTPREQPFHGVEALRLSPVGGGGIFGRDGLLAHSYMLGANGDSNGCVSFKNYDAFLQAFKAGLVKRLAVVARLNDHRSDLKMSAANAKTSTAPTGAGRTQSGVM